jgi:hypothetical protein
MDAKNYTCKERKASHFICSLLPPVVAFETAHAASFLISNSACDRSNKSGGNILALITACNGNGVH